ncbi:MAG: hypothetical protein H7Y33_13960 [Cytophagales bacterium]|nr:hypothetical protein [Rhizobacter sp.]
MKTRELLKRCAAIVCAAALALSVPIAHAHHAFAAEFDANTPLLLRGKISRIEWINPHAWVHIVVEEPGKPPKTWAVEGGTPNTLLRAGLSKDTLKIGTEIVVRGFQSKDHHCEPTCKANGRDVTFPDGRKVFMGSSGTGAPRDGSDPNEPPK